MPGKIKLIQIAEQPKRNPFARAAAGVLLSGVLAASCAPGLVRQESRSTIAATAAQPEKTAPGWKAFCDKHKLNDKEKAALGKLFLLEHDKTGFWHSGVFETLMKNTNVRKNYLESAILLISSVLQRSKGEDGSKRSLDAVSVFLSNKKLGRAEFDTALKIVENDPTMNPDKISAVYDAAFTFSNENYSPEFSKMFRKFFFGKAVSGYLSSNDMNMIIDSFHALAINRSYSPEMLGIISETLDYFSERVPELVKKNAEEFKKNYGGNFHPFFLYHGPNSKDAASAILAALSNPNLNQQMLEDLHFELVFILSPENEEDYYGKSIVESLAKIYGQKSFGAEASAKLRSRFSRKYAPYRLTYIAESLQIIAEGRKFNSYQGYNLIEAFEELERFDVFIAKRECCPVSLAHIAAIMANGNYSGQISSILNFLLRNAGDLAVEEALSGLSSLMENKHFSSALAGKFEKISRKVVRLPNANKVRKAAFVDLVSILEESKDSANALNNVEFILSQKGIAIKPVLSLMAVLAGRKALMGDVSLPEKLEKAKVFAQRIGARHKNPEICLNFAYALQTIGEEKTKSLHERFGIEYFGRYSKELLEEIFLSEYPARKQFAPIAFFVYNKNDWNGAFYTDERILSSFIKDYRVCLIEVDSEKDFFEGVESFALKRMGSIGNSKIRALVLGGHGYSGGVNFGSSQASSSELTASDMRRLKELKGYFSEKPTVILISCSTGKNKQSIGAKISETLGAQLFAPEEPGNISSISFGPNGEIHADYTVPHSEFESGKMKKEEKK